MHPLSVFAFLETLLSGKSIVFFFCAQAPDGSGQVAQAFTSLLQQKEVNKKCRRFKKISNNQVIFLKSENSPDLSFVRFLVPKNQQKLISGSNSSDF